MIITAVQKMKPVLDRCRRWRFLILLGMLLALLVVQPVLFGYSVSPIWFDACFLLVIVALVFSFSQDRKWRTAPYALGISSALLSMGGHLVAAQGDSVLLLAGHSIGAVLLLLGLAVVVKAILVSAELTLDSVFGAVCGYLLLGMAWALLYSVVDSVWPGSFTVSSGLAEYVEHGRARIQLLVYYSFVTLTTTGYGDITPVSAPSRTFAWLEAMTGQFYLAVLVAGLVGALINGNDTRFRAAPSGTAGMPAAS
jgi:voltage-gated potassium channel